MHEVCFKNVTLPRLNDGSSIWFYLILPNDTVCDFSKSCHGERKSGYILSCEIMTDRQVLKQPNVSQHCTRNYHAKDTQMKPWN